MPWIPVQEGWIEWIQQLDDRTKIAIATPFILLAWWYVIKFLRYLLDGVFAWGWWLAKVIGISLVVGIVCSSLAFNGYMFLFYSHIEPIVTLQSFIMTNVAFVHFSWISANTVWSMICDAVHSILK